MEYNPSLAWKVGAFILGGLLLVGLLIFGLQGYRPFAAGYTIQVVLHSAAGIARGAPVQFAGVKVGQVQSVTISRSARAAQPQVILSIWLPADLVIRADDRAQIGLLGLLGEKYLQIEPGAGRGAIIKPGGRLSGEEPLNELALMRQAQQTLQQLDEALTRANALLAPRAVPERLGQMLADADRLSLELQQSARQAQELMQPWQKLGRRANALLDGLARRAGLIAAALVGLIAVLLIF